MHSRRPRAPRAGHLGGEFFAQARRFFGWQPIRHLRKDDLIEPELLFAPRATLRADLLQHGKQLLANLLGLRRTAHARRPEEVALPAGRKEPVLPRLVCDSARA